jgi:rod shape determining protein RodA
LTLLPMALVLFQPNLGLSLMFPPILLAMLFVAGAKARYLYLAVFAVVLSLGGAYFLGDHLTFLKPYQRDRIKAFLVRDASTSRNEGLQLHQSLIAIGSGGAFGKGFGEGTQNTLEYLPEKETDFIFSIIAEETGFAGACTVVLLLFSLAGLILKVAVHTREPFGRLVATGIATVFAAQSFENIGMTLGLTPITGIALPFLSLAGSNLVASYIAIGIVLGIASSSVPVVATKDLDPQDSKGFQVVVEDRAAALLQARWPVE